MKHYICLPDQKYPLGDYALTSIQPEHIENIRQWRNAQMDVLRQQEVITKEQQQQYFAGQVWSELADEQPSKILLSFLHRGQLIGYGGLVHLAWAHRRGEISFLVAPERTSDLVVYEQDFSHFLQLIQKLAFKTLKLNRIFTETYAHRKHHLALLEANGMQLEGTLREHVLIKGQAVDSLIHGCLSSSYEI